MLALTPDSLADAKQPFLIYNPDKKTYLFVSKDIKATGKKNPYVEARNDRLGRRNMFTFEEVKDQKDKYFIFNVELKAYLYVSNSKSGVVRYWNNNVLASTEKPTEADQLKKYIFEFEDDDGDGFYKIKNQEKYLYVSAHYFGVPANALVKATNQKELDRWDSKFFQFALKDVRHFLLLIFFCLLLFMAYARASLLSDADITMQRLPVHSLFFRPAFQCRPLHKMHHVLSTSSIQFGIWF